MPIPSSSRRSTALSSRSRAAITLLALSTVAGCSADPAEPAASTRPNGPATTALTYDADDGPGAVGATIDPAELGITGAVAAATKIGRRTYRLPEEGGSSTFVVPPQRWRDAEAAAIASRQAPAVADCGELATHDATAADAALDGLTADSLGALDVVDRQYAVSERLLPMLEDSRAFLETMPCDLNELASAVLDRIDPTTRDVMARALTPLDLNGAEAVEREPSLDPALLAGLLQPVQR